MLPVLGDTVLSVVSPPVLDDTLHGSVKTTYASTEYQHKFLIHHFTVSDHDTEV
jgi:hypothetical protein